MVLERVFADLLLPDSFDLRYQKELLGDSCSVYSLQEKGLVGDSVGKGYYDLESGFKLRTTAHAEAYK